MGLLWGNVLIFRSKNNSWVLNNHFYPTKSYSKWNMAGKTNLSASRSMQFLTGKSHLARRIFFFQMSSRKLWLMSLTWWMVISICELPTQLKDFTAAYTVTLYQLNCALFNDFIFLKNCWPQFSVPTLKIYILKGILKSDNLQYNRLARWVTGTKRLMFQVLLFFHNFLQNSLKKSFQLIFLFFIILQKWKLRVLSALSL